MIKYFKSLALALIMMVACCLMSCEVTPEQMIVGKWKVTSAVQTHNDASGTVSEDLPGFDDYHYEFDASGLCKIHQRQSVITYEWFLTEKRQLVLTNYSSDPLVYDVPDLQKRHMTLVYKYEYQYGPDSLTYKAEHRFELEKE